MKWFIIILLASELTQCTSNDNLEKVIIGVKNNTEYFGKWYRIEKQFINSNDCKEKVHASAFLCVTEKKDTIWILSPCFQSKIKQGTEAVLYKSETIREGDSIISRIPRFYIGKYRFIVGDLRVPFE